jgi:hypothetical protein
MGAGVTVYGTVTCARNGVCAWTKGLMGEEQGRERARARESACAREHERAHIRKCAKVRMRGSARVQERGRGGGGLVLAGQCKTGGVQDREAGQLA